MKENPFSLPHMPEVVGGGPEALIHDILTLLEPEATYEVVDDTYEIDSDNLRLSFTLEDDLLEIRNIESLQAGLGQDVLDQIHSFALMHKMTVIASHVKDTARSFWQKMGYYEGSTAGEFIKR